MVLLAKLKQIFVKLMLMLFFISLVFLTKDMWMWDERSAVKLAPRNMDSEESHLCNHYISNGSLILGLGFPK